MAVVSLPSLLERLDDPASLLMNKKFVGICAYLTIKFGRSGIRFDTGMIVSRSGKKKNQGRKDSLGTESV